MNDNQKTGELNTNWIQDSQSTEKTGTVTTYSYKKHTGWECHLFGSNGIDGITYTPPRDYKPNLLVRLMCKWLLDCKWVEIKQDIDDD